MEHLVHLVQYKTGISEAQAKEAVELVLAQIKLKFPQILHSEIDAVAAGGNFGDSFKEKLGGVTESIGTAAKNVGEKAGALGEELAERLNEFFRSAHKPPTGS